QAEDGIRDRNVTGVQTCALPIYSFGPLLANLAHPGAGIMSPAIIEEDYKQMEEGKDPDTYINQNPVGTGLFKLENWTPGEEIILSKFDDYHDEQANLDQVTFKVMPEESSRIANLLSGTIDVAHDIETGSVTQIKNEEGVYLVQQPSFTLNYVGFNTQKEPFDDMKVRQAISKAIDKESII